MTAAGLKADTSFTAATFTLKVDKDGRRYWEGNEFGSIQAPLLKFPAEDFPIGAGLTLTLPMTRTYPKGGNGEE